jgi:DNA-binding beta-propeller fold protein YncE
MKFNSFSLLWPSFFLGANAASLGDGYVSAANFAGIPPSEDGSGIYAKFNSPSSIRISPDGYFALVCDTKSHLIRYLNIDDASVTTLAGDAVSLQSGTTDGVGTESKFNSPTDLSFTPDGVFVLVADAGNHLIRLMNISDASVTTLAGGVASGATNGIGTNSRFSTPYGISVAPNGIYALVADRNNNLIRRIVLSTVSVSTLAGSLSSGSTNGVGTNSKFSMPSGISISPLTYYALVADTNNHQIRMIDLFTGAVTILAGSAGSPGTASGFGTAARFNFPMRVSISWDWFAFVADTSNHFIRRIEVSSYSVFSLVGLGGSLGSANGVGTNVRFNSPLGIDPFPEGSSRILVADTGNNLIRQLDHWTTQTTTLAGVGVVVGSANGIGTNSQFNSPTSVCIALEVALVADHANFLIRQVVLATVSVSTLAGVAGSFGATNGIGTNSRFYNPSSVSLSSDASFALIADTSNHLLRHITLSSAAVVTLAGETTSAEVTNGIGTNSHFNSPSGVCVSPDGLYALVIDGSPLIRHVDLSTASVTTLAGSVPGTSNGIGTNANFAVLGGISISPDGLIALVTGLTMSQIRQIVISTASVTTLAGPESGLGYEQFSYPCGISISPDGLFALVADQGNRRIQSVTISTGSVITVAGVSSLSGAVNGIGTNINFNNPMGVSVSPDGSFAIVADTGNHLLRILSIVETDPTYEPTLDPTHEPTYEPTLDPTHEPTYEPTLDPTHEPTYEPTLEPTYGPTLEPTSKPTLTDSSTGPSSKPSSDPTFAPTRQPSLLPTCRPSYMPISPRSPTRSPTLRSLNSPTKSPTRLPSFSPSISFQPSPQSSSPTNKPTSLPSSASTTPPLPHPSTAPSSCPTVSPSTPPSSIPSTSPSTEPTSSPTQSPTAPTLAPIPKSPTWKPTLGPTQLPSVRPTAFPSIRPTSSPTMKTGGTARFDSLSPPTSTKPVITVLAHHGVRGRSK